MTIDKYSGAVMRALAGSGFTLEQCENIFNAAHRFGGHIIVCTGDDVSYVDAVCGQLEMHPVEHMQVMG